MDKTVKFKTSLKCGGCVAKITPLLNSMRNVAEWTVDLNTPERVLTVTLKDGDTIPVRKAVTGAGFKIEEMK